jgi:hypothetical protein
VQFHVKGPRDLVAGLLFVVVGALAAFTAWRYPMGTALHMGAGYFPLIAACGLTIAGILVAIRGLAGQEHRVPAIHLKPLLLVLAAVALFAVLIERLGLVITVPSVVTLGYLANPRVRPVEMLLTAAVLTVSAVVVFQRLLELPFPLWPR